MLLGNSNLKLIYSWARSRLGIDISLGTVKKLPRLTTNMPPTFKLKSYLTHYNKKTRGFEVKPINRFSC